MTAHGSMLSDAIYALLAGGAGQTLILADDTDVTVPASPGTTVVLYTALSAGRIVHLPPASSAPMTVIVKDATGGGAETNGIDISVADGDNVDGNGQITAALHSHPFGLMIMLVNDGMNDWWDLGGPSTFVSHFFDSLTGQHFDLPTSDPVVAGQLWNNGGVVNVSAGT
jgi:hypothetical protein